MQALLLSLIPFAVAQPAPVSGLKVPPGFSVTQFADHTLANDIYCMTLDPRGRIVVSGRGYIKVLVDDDDDGRADRAIDFADSPRDGAMGLLWEKETLYVTGDGGLRKFTDADGDGKADGPPELIKKLKTGGEHTAHAIARGPDGWLYVLCGDQAGIDRSYATTPTSPVKDPIGGCVIRLSPDLKECEIVAHGFRNAYGMDFDWKGDLFTYDSDNERCLSLPWYEPTRFYHVVEGRFHGWLGPQRASFWRMPPYFLDVMPPACYLGRGSPTGIVCYAHGHFPGRYHGIYALDWTFGKIHLVRLKRDGAGYRGTPEVFLEATGDNGFAPTAAVVHPGCGDLFVSVGGRGTRGAVYRIRHPEAWRTHEKGLAPKPARPADLDGADVERMLRHADFQLPYLIKARSRLAAGEKLAPAWIVRRCWDTHDRHVRWAVVNLLREAWPTLDDADRQRLTIDARKPSESLVLAWALAEHEPEKSLGLTLALLDRDLHPRIVLDALRLTQILLGDIGDRSRRGTFAEGYSLRAGKTPAFIKNPKALVERLIGLHGVEASLDAEIVRLLALLGCKDAEALRILEGTLHGKADGADLSGKVHAAIALARHASLPASSLLDIVRVAEREGLPRESNWALRMKELARECLKADPEEVALLIQTGKFGESADLMLVDVEGFPRKETAALFLERLKSRADVPITPALVGLLGELPPREVAPLARKWWDNAGLQTAILPILARAPQAEDYARFVSGLGQPDTIRVCLAALERLPAPREERGVEALALVRGLRQTPEKDLALREAILARLAVVAGGKAVAPKLDAWLAHLRKAHPDLAAKLDNPDGVDVAGWEKRLARIIWDKGDAARGHKAFIKASCFQCHGGSQSVGPDLAGVTKRFARADLFAAILQPSKDVADRYRTTLVESKEGKVYQGLVIYDAIDSLILHTRDGATVRLPGADVAERRQVDVSPMPAGLLDALNDEEIADLYAYLRK